MTSGLLPKHSETFYAVLRIVAGLLFACHGAQKLFGAFADPSRPGGAVALVSLMGLGGAIEFFGGLLIAAGALTGPAAFLASGMMAVAYFMVHFPSGFWPIQNRGELAAVYCFLFLLIAIRGAGPWSVDAAIARRRGGGR